MKYKVTLGERTDPIEIDLGAEHAVLNGSELFLNLGGKHFRARRLASGDDPACVRFVLDGWSFEARVESDIDRLRAQVRPEAAATGIFRVESPLPGAIRRVIAAPGQEVHADTPLFTLEAMKMENEIRAGRTGRLTAVLVQEGQIVNAGDLLAKVEPR